MNNEETKNPLDQFLATATPWQVRAVEIISAIPSGWLASYGSIAQRLGNRNGARSVGELRRELYRVLGYEPRLPLHRVCTQGDILSLRDSEETRERNTRLRSEEGSLESPLWL